MRSGMLNYSHICIDRKRRGTRSAERSTRTESILMQGGSLCDYRPTVPLRLSPQAPHLNRLGLTCNKQLEGECCRLQVRICRSKIPGFDAASCGWQALACNPLSNVVRKRPSFHLPQCCHLPQQALPLPSDGSCGPVAYF